MVGQSRHEGEQSNRLALRRCGIERAAMAGQTFTAPSGITSTMDAKNHHLHKAVFIGEVKADGQFNVVWKTPAP